jgi:hypothetical protein
MKRRDILRALAAAPIVMAAPTVRAEGPVPIGLRRPLTMREIQSELVRIERTPGADGLYAAFPSLCILWVASDMKEAATVSLRTPSLSPVPAEQRKSLKSFSINIKIHEGLKSGEWALVPA